MKKNKNIKTITAILITLGFMPLIGMGFDASSTPQPRSNNLNVLGWINGIVNLMWWIFVAGVVILFLIAGLSFLTAQGDTTKLEAARKFVLWGAIGVLVGIVGFSITMIIGVWFGF